MSKQLRCAGIIFFRYCVGLLLSVAGLSNFCAILRNDWDMGYHEMWQPAYSVLGLLVGLPSVVIAIGLHCGKAWAAKMAVILDAAVIPLLAGYAVAAIRQPGRSGIDVPLSSIGAMILPFLLEALWLGRSVIKHRAVRCGLMGTAVCTFCLGIAISLAIREWVSHWLA